MNRELENPFEFMTEETSLDKELVYKQLFVLPLVSRYAGFRSRVTQQRMIETDYETRDFFLTGAYPGGELQSSSPIQQQ